MCTVIKCDPLNPGQTCAQDQSWDYDFLSRSDTVFNTLKLSGTFAGVNTDLYKYFSEIYNYHIRRRCRSLS